MKLASAKYRTDIAGALTAATPVMLIEARGRPDDPSIRRALARWAFNTKQRDQPPADVAEVLSWVARNSTPLSALADAAVARQVLHQATGREWTDDGSSRERRQLKHRADGRQPDSPRPPRAGPAAARPHRGVRHFP